MDYSLSTVFVLPVGNVLPTTGSTQNLTAGKFGVFKDEARTIATNGNISTAAFIQFFQGRDATIGAITGSKPSDKIKASKVKKWYKVVGSSTAANEIQVLSNFNAKCGESLTVSIRAHSSYLNMLSFNGLSKSVTIKTPCCACGVDPCTTVDNEGVVNLILAAIANNNLGQTGTGTLNISTFFTFTKVGVGTAATLVIETKPLTVYGQPCDVAAGSFEYDRIWFRTFVYSGAPTTVDFLVSNGCTTAAQVVVTQRSSFPRGTSADVKQAEKDYYSYQSPFKHLFRTAGYNQYFESFVTDGTIYDLYVIHFDEYAQDDSCTPNLKEDEKVLVFIPQGESSTIETMLVTYLGPITDVSGNAITTTTTTTSSTTTSTTTTTLIP